ncbi:teneurin-2-like [Coregonus clupeaformis]|uniref:teneurin-2-like n=1 Tax=Coregonus clupeaformis TaxID=59861 RepID=UPI001BE11DC8|nr:teneurin-2-like [Coregonus clupeaformis]
MDLKDRRGQQQHQQRSLTRARCGKDPQYIASSLDTEECRVPTQKSYSSSETLKAFDHHDQRLVYGGCTVADLVHHKADEYNRQGGCLDQASMRSGWFLPMCLDWASMDGYGCSPCTEHA